MKSYKTVACEGRDEFTEKKSRFIGYAAPVTTQEEAIGFVDRIRKTHPDARHNVYAYVLRDNHQQRFSDDGEPQGTAGMPVLDTIRKQDLTDVALVVTRYFGGILLGGGGLVRAYGHAASLALRAAGIVEMRYSAVYDVEVEYTLLGKVEYELRKLSLQAENRVYDAKVHFSVSVPVFLENTFEKTLTEATCAKAVFQKTQTCYRPLQPMPEDSGQTDEGETNR